VVSFKFNLLNLKKIKYVADIGCGNGRHLKSLGMILKQAEIRGFDHSIEEINKLKWEFQNHKCQNNNLYQFFNQDIREIELSSNSQDLVICSEVLEHVPNFKKVIEECKRVLKPSGVMLISVPSFLPERLCWNYSKKYMQSPGGHIRIFKREYLKKSLEDQGLKIFKFHREHALHSFYWIFKAKNNMEDSKFTKSIHELLIKQMFGKARFSAYFERCLNPLFGKSDCFYLRK